MKIDWKDRTSWEGILDKVFSSLVGDGYRDILRSGAKDIEYVDSADEGCNLFNDRATKDDIVS